MRRSDTLREGWARAALGDCAALVTKGSTPTTYGHEYTEIGVAFVRVENLRNGFIDTQSVSVFIDDAADETLKRSRLQAGDLLFSIAGTIGRTAIVLPEDLPANTNQAVAIIRGFTRVLVARFLKVILSSSLVQDRAATDARGGAMSNISLGDVRSLQIPIPPVPEQRRIVAKIEELFSMLDAGVAALERVRANLKRYRASVLKAAVEGRLTDQWRAEHPDTEPASVLLQRILRERRRRWEEEQLAKFAEKGRKPPKDWQSKYKEPQPPDTSDLPELPEGWVWGSIDQLAEHSPNSITDGPFGSNLKTSHYTEAGPRVIRLQNVGEGIFVDEEAHISQKHFETLRKHEVFPEDLVVATLGDRPPRACVVPEWLGPAIVKADVVRFRPHRRLASVGYLNATLNAEPTKTRGAGIVHGVGRPRLNLSELRQLPLPLPPLPEQAEIVAEVERRLSVVDEIEAEVEAGLKRAARLRQAILKRAFEGRLVPQDPEDEPASALLERIRAEREADQQRAVAPRRRRFKQATSEGMEMRDG